VWVPREKVKDISYHLDDIFSLDGINVNGSLRVVQHISDRIDSRVVDEMLDDALSALVEFKRDYQEALTKREKAEALRSIFAAISDIELLRRIKRLTDEFGAVLSPDDLSEEGYVDIAELVWESLQDIEELEKLVKIIRKKKELDSQS